MRHAGREQNRRHNSGNQGNPQREKDQHAADNLRDRVVPITDGQAHHKRESQLPPFARG